MLSSVCLYRVQKLYSAIPPLYSRSAGFSLAVESCSCWMLLLHQPPVAPAVQWELFSCAVVPSVCKSTTLIPEGCLWLTPVLLPLRKSALFSLTTLPSSVPALCFVFLQLHQLCAPVINTTVETIPSHLTISTWNSKTLFEVKLLLFQTVFE